MAFLRVRVNLDLSSLPGVCTRVPSYEIQILRHQPGLISLPNPQLKLPSGRSTTRAVCKLIRIFLMTPPHRHPLVSVHDHIAGIRQPHGDVGRFRLAKEAHSFRLAVRFARLQVQVDVLVEVVGEMALELVDGVETEGVKQAPQGSSAVMQSFVAPRWHCLLDHRDQT